MPPSYPSFFSGKKVTLLGLGLLGRGVGDAAFLARHCAQLQVTDMKSAEELRPSLEALTPYDNISFTLGRNDASLFDAVDCVVKGNGVRLDHPCIERARENGIPVYMSTALFAQFSPIPLIGITGTRGKTTVTCMIAEILRRAGKKVLLGGNIRGVSTLALLPEAASYDVGVLELDSWQLQGFEDLKLSPHLSVFTTFYPDHMNYYDGAMDRYLFDKTAIFRHQKLEDTLFLSEQAAPFLQKEQTEHSGAWITVPPLPPTFGLQIPGAHNRLNGALAKAASVRFGIGEEIADAALRAFTGVEGRLHALGTYKDRLIYNDNNATTQEATLAALDSFSPEATVLIFGGADKGLPIDRLAETLVTRKIRCVLLAGTGSDRILPLLPTVPPRAASMAEAVDLAFSLSKPRDTILLSPAFASFGLFQNEYDRNDQFVAEIKKLPGFSSL